MAKRKKANPRDIAVVIEGPQPGTCDQATARIVELIRTFGLSKSGPRPYRRHGLPVTATDESRPRPMTIHGRELRLREVTQEVAAALSELQMPAAIRLDVRILSKRQGAG